MKLIVTTAQSGRLSELAREWAKKLDCPFVARRDLNLSQLLQEEQAEAVLVVAAQKISCFYQGSEFFFHPSLAQLRILELERGQGDNLVHYLDLKPGDQILDCTLGLAADALTAAWAVGAKGRVTGLESSPIIAALVKDGLLNLAGNLAAPASRIEVIQTDYRDFLLQAADNSYDIVYFDPMFRHKIKNSSAMDALRPFTNQSALEPELLAEAWR
ncbi:MAG: class I SAM-dependent methyltransferase, partial [Clostridia bacterium]|nr:class I SAM-dependent methyltransferase [Clostridia bacterium]